MSAETRSFSPPQFMAIPSGANGRVNLELPRCPDLTRPLGGKIKISNPCDSGLLCSLCPGFCRLPALYIIRRPSGESLQPAIMLGVDA